MQNATNRSKQQHGTRTIPIWSAAVHASAETVERVYESTTFLEWACRAADKNGGRRGWSDEPTHGRSVGPFTVAVTNCTKYQRCKRRLQIRVVSYGHDDAVEVWRNRPHSIVCVRVWRRRRQQFMFGIACFEIHVSTAGAHCTIEKPFNTVAAKRSQDIVKGCIVEIQRGGEVESTRTWNSSRYT